MESNAIQTPTPTPQTPTPTPQTPNQPPQIPKQIFQMHVSKLESSNTYNNECHSFITKNISSFISVLEPFKNKLHSLSINCASSNLPLFKIFKRLFEHYYSSINHLIDNIKLINQRLDAPLKNYQASFYKIKQLKDLQNKFMTSHSKLTNAKQNYTSELKKFKQYQISNLNTEEQTDEIAIGQSRIISKIKDYENDYKTALKEINHKLEMYNKQGSTILQEIQRNEHILQSSFQLQVKAFANYWIDKAERDSQFITQLKKLIEDNNNPVKTGGDDLYKVCIIEKFEFEPFEIKELKNLENARSKVRIVDRKLHDFICTCKKEFSDIAKDYDVNTEKKKQELMIFCNNVLEFKNKRNDNENINYNSRHSIMNNSIIQANDLTEYYKTIMSFLNDRELRLFFLMYLNYQRSKGQFELKNKVLFKMMGIIMQNIIKIFNKEKDFPSMRIMLILSQTYYTLNAKKQKVYLIRYFDTHSLFKEKDFWRFYFGENIKMEIENFDKQQFQNEFQKVRMRNNMIYSKIMAGCHNMIDFGNTKEFIKEMAKEFAEKFELEKENKDMIMMMVDEVKIEEKAEMDKSLELISRDSKGSRGSGKDSSIVNMEEEKSKEKIEEVKGEEKNIPVKVEGNNMESKKDETIKKEDNVNDESKVRKISIHDKKENTVVKNINKEEQKIEDKKEDISSEHKKNIEDTKEENIIENEITKESLKKDENNGILNSEEKTNEEQQGIQSINEVEENELKNKKIQDQLV